jgi:arylsulfatase A-like enzyme
MRNLIWLVFDSARYDAFMAARTPAMDRIAPAQRRWSYASWTAPAHLAFLMGLMPHTNQPGGVASDRYREELSQWRERLEAPSARPIGFADFVPTLSLPAFLRRLGYRTAAYVSLPVLNAQTVLAAHFDEYELLPAHNDLSAVLDRLRFGDAPRFYFINTGETHYPYRLPGETGNGLPVISGLHGVWRGLDDFLRDPSGPRDTVFDPDLLRPLWHKQVRCIEHLDGVVARLCAAVPAETWFIITSDHGELFGEDGYFGHGPICHEKVFEVFFLEGRHPDATARGRSRS